MQVSLRLFGRQILRVRGGNGSRSEQSRGQWSIAKHVALEFWGKVWKCLVDAGSALRDPGVGSVLQLFHSPGCHPSVYLLTLLRPTARIPQHF